MKYAISIMKIYERYFINKKTKINQFNNKKELIMNNNISQINGKSDNKSANKGVLQKLTKTSKYLPLFLLVGVMVFVPEVYAKTGDTKVFEDATTKILGWVTGGFGKLLVAVSVILSVIMGVAGFKWQQIMLPLVLGLLLGSINGIVGLFF